jgi:NADPH-dependent ferric siderophore reductase
MRIPTVAAAVLRARSVTPRMRRVTLGGAELDALLTEGLADERVKLILPGARTIRRTLTVRRFDRAARELDLEIALHDGPAATWSLHAPEGSEVRISGATGGYELDNGIDHHLIAGDEAALPGIATILERLPARARADVFAEVADPSAELGFETRADTQVNWLRRDTRQARPGDLLVDAVSAYELSRAPVRVWAAGEALAMRAIRRRLRDEVGLPRDRYRVVGYWRDRLSEDQAIETHLKAQESARAAGASEDEIDDAGLY